MTKSKQYFIYLILALAITLNGCNSSPKGFVIKGFIDGVEPQILDGILYLRHSKNGTLPIDSAVVKEGEFLLQGHIDIPDKYLLIIKGIPNAIPLFLENDKYSVRGDSKNLRDAVVSGGVSNRLFLLTNHKNRVIYQKYNLDVVLKRLVELPPLDSTRESFENSLDSANYTMREFIDSLVSSNPLTFYSLHNLMANSRSAKLSLVEAELEVFRADSVFIKHPFYEEINNNIEIRTKLLPGKVAPLFSLYDSNSKLRSIADHFSSSSATILIFCSLWNDASIEYCRSIRDAYDSLADKNINVVSVAINSNLMEWNSINKKEKFKWVQLFDRTDSAVNVLYNVQTIPRAFLLDSLGVIINSNIQLKDLDSLI
ncbi:MAG: DUF4369 domain-containing protein [Bacteroidales bacterium]